MLLEELVQVSSRVGATRSRLQKTAELSALLRRLEPQEAAVGVSYLSGLVRQGKTGIGYASVRKAHGIQAASSPSLAILEVDAALERISTLSGSGSSGSCSPAPPRPSRTSSRGFWWASCARARWRA